MLAVATAEKPPPWMFMVSPAATRSETVRIKGTAGVSAWASGTGNRRNERLETTAESKMRRKYMWILMKISWLVPHRVLVEVSDNGNKIAEGRNVAKSRSG